MKTPDETAPAGEAAMKAPGLEPGPGTRMAREGDTHADPGEAPGAPLAGAQEETLRRAGEAEARANAGFDDLLRAASRQCRRLVAAKAARIWVVRRAGRRLVAFDFPDEDEARVPVELRRNAGDGPAGWAIDHRRPLHLGPGDPKPVFKGHGEAFESVIVLPLFRRGQVFAAIEVVDKRDGGPFTDEDYDRLEAASEQIALAMDNAMLHQATERRALEKDVLLEVSRMLAAPHDLGPKKPDRGFPASTAARRCAGSVRAVRRARAVSASTPRAPA
jgi:GAF domain-containing protein